MTATAAREFWQGRCLDCAHPEHPLATCHELVGGGDPSNGPQYCPCAAEMEHMEQAIAALREGLNSALNQWAGYSDATRGPGWDFDYVATSTDGGDAEAQKFQHLAARAATPRVPA